MTLRQLLKSNKRKNTIVELRIEDVSEIIEALIMDSNGHVMTRYSSKFIKFLLSLEVYKYEAKVRTRDENGIEYNEIIVCLEGIRGWNEKERVKI